MTYFDKDQNILPELLDKKAAEIARSFIVLQKSGRNAGDVDSRASLSSAQLRRFYNDLKQLEKKVNSQGFARVKPLIKMVKSKAAYASNPKRQSKIPESFRTFLTENIDSINEEKEFKAFMLYFEAVVGFFYGMGVSNN